MNDLTGSSNRLCLLRNDATSWATSFAARVVWRTPTETSLNRLTNWTYWRVRLSSNVGGAYYTIEMTGECALHAYREHKESKGKIASTSCKQLT